MKVKILVADKFPEKYIQQLKDMDMDLDVSIHQSWAKMIYPVLLKMQIF